MSTERLDELGVPRRAFLKKAGVAVLAAPLIVSFGMDAIAEGSAPAAQSAPNQCFPNQTFANQLFPGDPLWDILSLLLSGLSDRASEPPPKLSVGEANPLAALAVEAGLFEASDEPLTAYNLWGQFITQAKARAKRLPEGLAEELIEEAERARELLDCN
jgi:hypothetical protein